MMRGTGQVAQTNSVRSQNLAAASHRAMEGIEMAYDLALLAQLMEDGR